MANELTILKEKQLGKSLKEDIDLLSEPSLKEELTKRIKKEAQTHGEKMAAGVIAKWLVMAACGEVILRWHPELKDYEPRRGNPQLSNKGGVLDNWSTVAIEAGKDYRMIARWLEKRKEVDAAGGDQGFFQLKIQSLIERWEKYLLKNDWKDIDPEIAEGPEPKLYLGRAENLDFLFDESIDIIITSPPYNLGSEKWPMGGVTDPTNDGREERKKGIGYTDLMPEKDYQDWQIECLKELYRVAKGGASFFYNHKIRQSQGKIIHPIDWLRRSPWIIRQEIVWDRVSTHNHCAQLFWPTDERIYWLTKGKPILPSKPIGQPTVWRFFGPVPNTWHPAPFCEELPKRCLAAIGYPGAIILDPFGGSMTTCYVAQEMGYQSIGIDINKEYLEQAQKTHGWTGMISE